MPTSPRERAARLALVAGAEPRRMSDFAGGLDSAILLLEDPGREVHWTEPRDLTLEEAKELLTSTPLEAGPHQPEDNYFTRVYHGRRAALIISATIFAALIVLPIGRSRRANEN